MKKIDLKILIDYLAGYLQPGEREIIEKWISENSSNKEYFERIKKIWDSPPQNFSKPNVEEALAKVLDKIHNPQTSATSLRLIYPKNKKALPRILFNSGIVKAAAAILLISLSVYVFSNLFTSHQPALVKIENKNIQQINLSDGTQVTLDAGSRFEYPEDFSIGEIREVKLRGEAYFQVAKNDRAPFVIHAGNGLIKVVGTKFNISAWENKSGIIVAVEEGKVLLKSDARKDSVFLTRGKMSTIKSGGEISEPADIDITQYLSWLKREFYFKNASFNDVIDLLARWYNKNIEVKDSTLFKNRITVFIQNKPLEENLNLLSVMLNFNYVADGDTVKIYSNKK